MFPNHIDYTWIYGRKCKTKDKPYHNVIKASQTTQTSHTYQMKQKKGGGGGEHTCKREIMY